MALSAEDKAEIAQLIAAATQAPAATPQPTASTQETTIAPAIEATQQALQHAGQTNPALALTADTLTQALSDALAKQTQNQESQLAKQLFDQQIDQLKINNPDLGNYLESEDEFEIQRMDRIKGIADYGERMKMLSKITNNFNQAQIGSVSITSPILSVRLIITHLPVRSIMIPYLGVSTPDT